MVPFEFYANDYLGASIPSDEWYGYATRAGEHLQRYKRIYTVTAPNENAENMAVCAMAEALYNIDLIANGEGGAVQSASIGSVSTNWSGTNAVDTSPAGQARELYRCACLHLDIYRGVG